ncbi:hypothetical protein M422DRAFT_248355 [Sphaerobolus stellatus SS14]|uniref:Uncharacterized protein n=1 Tax=Sphaerobolus stellatus (strain SS14) TaxID=990650 RepID=A0A0C9W4J9_SPHS4|nr:hypothetical protein M422DRAFT_248355 [Sphaerobolus stellatus SS14]
MDDTIEISSPDMTTTITNDNAVQEKQRSKREVAEEKGGTVAAVEGMEGKGETEGEDRGRRKKERWLAEKGRRKAREMVVRSEDELIRTARERFRVERVLMDELLFYLLDDDGVTLEDEAAAEEEPREKIRRWKTRRRGRSHWKGSIGRWESSFTLSPRMRSTKSTTEYFC